MPHMFWSRLVTIVIKHPVVVVAAAAVVAVVVVVIFVVDFVFNHHFTSKKWVKCILFFICFEVIKHILIYL